MSSETLAKILPLHKLHQESIVLPHSWKKAAGIFQGKKRINALQYQRQIRAGWRKRRAR